ALKRRGITPEAIRQIMIDIGPRPVDITLSWKNLYAYNRKIIDPIADRYFFVQEPRELVVKAVPRDFTAHILLHPDYPRRGTRTFEVRTVKGEARLLVSDSDVAIFKGGSALRLMELFNVEIDAVDETGITAHFLSEPYEEARRLGAPLIHWLPSTGGVSCSVMMPDGTFVNGLAEETLRGVSADRVVQFERFGFVRVDEAGKRIVVFFAHK
ncbi:MAG: glutamate--tRNA ligase, partial [Candidatus Bathyarchaeota archaeon]|nr:glutamate--tRNA ligase [Candidatus Bathyarchaeota archaeon]